MGPSAEMWVPKGREEAEGGRDEWLWLDTLVSGAQRRPRRNDHLATGWRDLELRTCPRGLGWSCEPRGARDHPERLC